MPPPFTVMRSVIFGSYASKSEGKSSLGASISFRFARPLNLMVRSMASLAFTVVLAVFTSIFSSPTAPMKSAGLPSGRSITVTSAALLVIFTGVPLLKKPAFTRKFKVMGAIRNLPDRCGKSNCFFSTATL